MASSASSAEPPPQHRSHRWTVVFTFASFLALLLLLQSEGLATRFTAVQDVVTKNVSLRGVGTYPGVEITADSNGELETEAVDEAVAATKAEEEAAAKKAADEAAAEAKKVEEEAAAKKAAEEVATAAKKAEEEAAAKKAADEAAAIAEKAEEEAAVKKAEEEVAAKKAAEEAAVAAKQAEEEAASKKVADEAAAAEAPAKEDKPLPSARDDREGVPNDCPTKCSARVEQHKHRWGGDLSNTADVKRLVTQARNKLVARLKVDYGEENFGKIFEVNGESRGRRAFSSANETQAISTKRFKRKLKMKILAVQKAIQEEEDNVGGCDCRGETKAISLRYLADETMSTGEALPDHYTRMVWATGGHSSAAGHGNLFNESYTAFLEKAVTDVFGSIGIDFEGRNYAMGGTSSGAEVALCSEAIFGTDPDVISWDYGMTDGRWFFRQGMYNNRIGINPNRPAIVGISVGGREQSSRLDQLQRVEDRGLTALLLNPDEFDAMIDAIPDTFGLTTEQINAMPKMVQHFRCGDAVEKGEPTCDANKYDTAMICPDRRYTAPWHPGW